MRRCGPLSLPTCSRRSKRALVVLFDRDRNAAALVSETLCGCGRETARARRFRDGGSLCLVLAPYGAFSRRRAAAVVLRASVARLGGGTSRQESAPGDVGPLRLYQKPALSR